MNKEQILAERTFSESGMDLWQRVHETLMQDKGLATARTAKLLAKLVATLEQKELLDISEVDDMLFDVVQ